MHYSMLERGNTLRVYTPYMWESVSHALKLYYIVCVCHIYINVTLALVFGHAKYSAYQRKIKTTPEKKTP